MGFSHKQGGVRMIHRQGGVRIFDARDKILTHGHQI